MRSLIQKSADLFRRRECRASLDRQQWDFAPPAVPLTLQKELYRANLCPNIRIPILCRGEIGCHTLMLR
jgi:hypothetical protein